MAGIEAACQALSAPADVTTTLARVAALLSPYYDKEIPQGVRQIEAEDWAEALEGFPEWAIKRACRWWKSAENGNRRKRPLEGDIVARVKVEMMAVRGMKIRLRSGTVGARTAPEPEYRVTKEEAAAIMKEVGFTPKKFGGKR